MTRNDFMVGQTVYIKTISNIMISGRKHRMARSTSCSFLNVLYTIIGRAYT